MEQNFEGTPANEARQNAVTEFLARPVPPTSTKEWNEWQAACKSLDSDTAIEKFTAALHTKSDHLQEVGLLGLRCHGYEAWAFDYEDKRHFEIRVKGTEEWQTIYPTRE